MMTRADRMAVEFVVEILQGELKMSSTLGRVHLFPTTTGGEGETLSGSAIPVLRYLVNQFKDRRPEDAQTVLDGLTALGHLLRPQGKLEIQTDRVVLSLPALDTRENMDFEQFSLYLATLP